jgi:hypothetical protein
VGVALIAGGSFAQSVSGQYEFAAQKKHTPNAITTVDGRNLQSNQDRATYYSENFDAMLALDGSEGWTAALQSGAVGFGLTTTGPANSAGSSFTIPTMTSTTPTQWVLLDSDSQGQSGTDEKATLTSNSIDLTVGGTVTVNGSTPLKLEFEQMFAEWEQSPNYDTLYVGISSGGGAFEEVQVSNGVGRDGRPNPETISLNISDWVTDATDVKIRFRWDGNWAYGWQIDNVSIQDLPPNDIEIVEVFRADVVNAYMYSKVPLAQATEFVIGVVARNIGFDPQTNVGFEWEITDPSSNTTDGSSLNADNISSLANGELDTVWVSTGMTPTELGNYSIEFTATQNETDDELSNNNLTDTYFELTTDVYGADYGSTKTAFYNWGGNDNGPASIGTQFFILANGVIGSIEAELDDNDAVIDQTFKYTVYITDIATGNSTFLAETQEYTSIASDKGSIVKLYLDEVITVTAGELYLVCAGHDGGDPSVGFAMVGSVPGGQTAGYNESATSTDLISSLSSPEAPILRIYMNEDGVGVEETASAKEGVSIYPNPANTNINVELTYANSSNTYVNVTDITGKVVKEINLGTVSGTETISISLENLTNGVYFVEVINSNSKEVKKFVKK